MGLYKIFSRTSNKAANANMDHDEDTEATADARLTITALSVLSYRQGKSGRKMRR